MATALATPYNVSLPCGVPAGGEGVLSPEALEFLTQLVQKFGPRVDGLLQRRRDRLRRLASGVERLGFRADTDSVRAGYWQVPSAPNDLVRRVVEITGPTDAKMLINALNSGANVYMADLEDATSPTWQAVVLGQRNLCEAVRRTLSFNDPRTGKEYRLRDTLATLVVRPRGWHLVEAHCVVDSRGVPAALFDFGLYFFHALCQ
jgi:malate synthase